MGLINSLFGNIERLYTGKIIKDYGYIIKGRCSYKIILTRKHRSNFVIIKQKVKMGLGMEIKYFRFDMKTWKKLMKIGDDIIKIDQNEPIHPK